MSKKKLAKKIKESGIVKYLIELSIVIIGVLITLSITGIISDKSKQHEVEGAMGFIRTELKESLDNLDKAKQKWEREQRAFLLLQKHINNLKDIPVDTLVKYQNVIGDRHSVSFESDSYEVLKSTLLMQYVEDKDFLRKLAKAYGGLQLIDNQMSRYNELKRAGLTHMLDNISEENIERWTNGNIYDYFSIPLSDKTYRIFMYTGRSVIDRNLFDECRQKVASALEDIDKHWE